MTLLLALACGSPEPGTTPTPDDTPTLTAPAPTTPAPTTPTPEPQPTTTAATTGDTVGTGDTSATTGGTTLPKGLHGIAPAKPVPPPTFTALNRDGTRRSQTDLLGQPTILWFYPAAGTGG